MRLMNNQSLLINKNSRELPPLIEVGVSYSMTLMIK